MLVIIIAAIALWAVLKYAGEKFQSPRAKKILRIIDYAVIAGLLLWAVLIFLP